MNFCSLYSFEWMCIFVLSINVGATYSATVSHIGNTDSFGNVIKNSIAQLNGMQQKVYTCSVWEETQAISLESFHFPRKIRILISIFCVFWTFSINSFRCTIKNSFRLLSFSNKKEKFSRIVADYKHCHCTCIVCVPWIKHVFITQWFRRSIKLLLWIYSLFLCFNLFLSAWNSLPYDMKLNTQFVF